MRRGRSSPSRPSVGVELSSAQRYVFDVLCILRLLLIPCAERPALLCSPSPANATGVYRAHHRGELVVCPALRTRCSLPHPSRIPPASLPHPSLSTDFGRPLEPLPQPTLAASPPSLRLHLPRLHLAPAIPLLSAADPGCSLPVGHPSVTDQLIDRPRSFSLAIAQACSPLP